MSISTAFSKLLVLVALSVHSADIVAAQNLREVAREQARRDPGVLLEQPAPPGDYAPKAIEELAREADVVLQARLTRIVSYLSSNSDRVLTDYSMVEASVIAGRLPLVSAARPGASAPLILTVYGGEVTVEGVRIRGTDHNREAIDDGGWYVLLLKLSRNPEAGRYEIHYGGIFEVVQGRVRPLLKDADRVFSGSVDADVTDLIARIRAAVPIAFAYSPKMNANIDGPTRHEGI